MFLCSARWGSAFCSMYAEVREGKAVGVAYYGKDTGNGNKIELKEKVFPSRAEMRSWVNTSGRLVASS